MVARKTVLIQGTGGVSIMALKLARGAGCKVIIASSSDSDIVKSLSGIGKILTINYPTHENWDVEAITLNGGRGVDIVLENGVTSSLLQSINASAKRGIISQVGYLEQQKLDALDGFLAKSIGKTITLRGINVGSRLELKELNRVVEANGIMFGDIIDKKFPFEQASEAFACLWLGQHVGKVIIELSDKTGKGKRTSK